jgi:hypothetical protein
MSRFFVNYRTGDESFAAVKLAECLADRFGEDNVFRDSRSIPIGVDFEPVLWRNLRESTALIVVIGPRWLTGSGTTDRLADPEDFVRREIEFAFQLALPVIPVLVGDVPKPDPDDLPASIRKLAAMQYLRISARSADRDLKDLIEKVAAEYGEDGVTLPIAPARRSLPAGTAEQVRRALPRARHVGDVVREDFAREDFAREDFAREDFAREDFAREDFIQGDKVMGDKVMGDKVMGDKVMGDKTSYGS